MKFVKDIKEKSGLSINKFSKELGVSRQLVTLWMEERPQKENFLRALCRLKEISGYEWNKFGKILEKEFKK